jgi:hypothetical protein
MRTRSARGFTCGAVWARKAAVNDADASLNTESDHARSSTQQAAEEEGNPTAREALYTDDEKPRLDRAAPHGHHEGNQDSGSLLRCRTIGRLAALAKREFRKRSCAC